jgi:hypothetical protein
MGQGIKELFFFFCTFNFLFTGRGGVSTAKPMGQRIEAFFMARRRHHSNGKFFFFYFLIL